MATSSTVWWPSGSIDALDSTRRSFTPMPRQLRKHVVEHRQAGRDLGLPRPVDVDLDGDGGLAGLAANGGGAHGGLVEVLVGSERPDHRVGLLGASYTYSNAVANPGSVEVANIDALAPQLPRDLRRVAVPRANRAGSWPTRDRGATKSRFSSRISSRSRSSTIFATLCHQICPTSSREATAAVSAAALMLYGDFVLISASTTCNGKRP